jgi:pimeloyl-ACP methyl ester carboxylesterase
LPKTAIAESEKVMRKAMPVLLLVLPCLAFVPAWRAAADLPKRVDGGGHPLRLRVAGKGSPTVVLEIGLGGPLEEWAIVQPAIASFTRVAAYDRLGAGHRAPRLTGKEICQELHTALANAGLEPPYILVGQSFGGVYNRLFASLYPEEVAGLVLLDPAQEEFIDWMEVHHPEQSLASFSRVDWPEAAGIEATLEELKSAGELPNIPVIVVTGSRTGEGKLRDQVLPMWTACHDRWATAQPRGRHVLAKASGHGVHVDEPDLVVELVKELVESARARTRLIE